MKDIRAKILSNREIIPGYFKMILDAPFIARNAAPGQFVQVRCTDAMDPLLRRPFGIHRVKGQGSRVKGIELLYEVVGKGTEVLSKKKKGDFVDVMGPLGNGFTLPSSIIHHPSSAILIAGGIGVAPLVFLAEVLVKQKIKVTVLIGARTKKLILCEKDFKKIGVEVNVTTDDGTRGYKGFVSKLFEEYIRHTTYDIRYTIYACGPHPMLRCIAEICRKQRIECQVSLEEKMACGIGACLGCAVKVKGERLKVKDKDFSYKIVCKDGPVFDTNHLLWQ